MCQVKCRKLDLIVQCQSTCNDIDASTRLGQVVRYLASCDFDGIIKVTIAGMAMTVMHQLSLAKQLASSDF